MEQVEVRRRIDAPRTAVWDLYTDYVSWSEWAGIGKVRLAQRGDPNPNGVGCVRVVGPDGFAAHEEILEFEPPERITYRVLKGGIPIRKHLGEVVFVEDGDATLVIWKCRFESKVPGIGWVLRAIVTLVFARTLDALARQRFPAGR